MATAATTAPADLTAFIAAERGRLVAVVAALLDDRALAEEVVQEAFVRAAARWHHVGGLASPGGWTYRVARNIATSTVRRRRAERRALARHGPDDDVHLDPQPADTDALQAALAELPDRQREAVLLRHYLGHDAATAADLMGTTPMAVRKLLQRGVASLRTTLEGVHDAV